MTSLLTPRVTIVALGLLIATGCGHVTPAVPAQQSGVAPSSEIQPAKATSILKKLKKQVVIGSTVDPKLHQVNPYGLAIAPSTNGDFTAGDVVVCNFNDKKNVQGTGYTVVTLHPKPGSTPKEVSEDKLLLGCDAITLTPGDIIFAAAFTANDDPFLGDNGKLVANQKGKPFDRPFGQIYAQTTSGTASVFESNAADGTIVRINLGSTITYDVIAKGFKVNHGKPGSILGPSGLSYNPNGDILYIVDGADNTVVSFSKASTIPNGGITVEKGGKFKGPSASDAHLVYSGAPLDAPISSALFFNGNLVVGNTGNPNGINYMIELSPAGKVLYKRNVDKGAAGAIFGMATAGTSAANTQLFFNDDNANDVQVLEK